MIRAAGSKRLSADSCAKRVSYVKVRIQKKSDEEMCREYPIAGRLPDWYFRQTETSNNAWLVEGSDVWGRKVSRQGGDPEKLLAECIDQAKSINASI